MANNLFGFIGSDKYELILYLSRILFHLGKKVLLVDFSESKALYQCIPIPETLNEGCDYIDYRGIDFIKGDHYYLDMNDYYDIVLLDLGFCRDMEVIRECSKIFLITDLQLHNIKRIVNMNLDNLCSYLIIKDVFPCKISPDYIVSQLGNHIDKGHIFILYQDIYDVKYRLNSQYDYKFKFMKLSKSTQMFLKEIALIINSNLDKKLLNQAYKRAERGT